MLPFCMRRSSRSIGLLLSLVRKGTVDAIAILATVALTMDIAAALLAPTVGIALVVPSPGGAFIGLALVISALIGPPRSCSWSPNRSSPAAPTVLRHSIN
jgi:hypothetical protein